MRLFGIVLFAHLIGAPMALGAGHDSTGAADSGLDHVVPMFPAASDGVRQGIVRIVNHSPRSGEVHIEAFDDHGAHYAPVTLEVDANETVHFHSEDLEDGNAAKGLAAGTGPGVGDWWLALASDLDIEVLSYVTTPSDGFLTSMHDVVAPEVDGVYRVAIFNPGSNAHQVSKLRLVNPGRQAAEVTITGVDDRGASPGGDVRVSVPAGAARTLTAQELESGAGLQGALGDGTGNWALRVESDTPVIVMSLLESATGHLTNLSTAPDKVDAGVHRVPLFPGTADPLGRQGLIRVINHSVLAGDVTVTAFDDTDRDFGSVTLSLGANETAHFNSSDLEVGNAAKGLAGSTGAGEGDWRLELSSDLNIEVLSYIRTHSDNFLTAMRDSVPREGNRHRVPIFYPGSNVTQMSRLRLVNAGNDPADVTITGIDGGGASSPGSVAVPVPAWASRTLTARELEVGGDGYEGQLGRGAGTWQLVVESERPVIVMSLLSSPAGHLTNLSTAPAANFAPARPAAFNDRVAGNRIIGANPANYIDFLADSRFRKTEGADTYEGVYTYNRTGTHLATVGLESDDGETCTYELAFASRTAGTLSFTCDEGAVGESTWYLVELNAEESKEYGAGETIDTLPTGFWVPDVTSGGSFQIGGGNTVISLNNGGYIEEGGYRYTCQSAGGCRVTNGVVDSGTIVETSTSTGTMPEDASPSFAGGSGPGDQTYTAGTAISTLTLPAASGGDGTLTYSLTADVPGLSFNAATRQLTGTPSTAGTHAMTYTATDEDGDTDSLRFALTVQEAVSASPDLVVQSPSVSDAGPEPGASITISATVRNQGAGESAATTLRYYRSADATITTGDTEAGTGAVSALAASTGSDESIGLTAPSAAGTYYYGACVDSVSGETDFLNNCSTAVRVTVGDSPMEIEGFDLASVNPWATGIVFASDRFFVVDLAAARIFAYQSSGERDTASDIDLDSDNGNATGLAFANGRLFVADWNDAKVYAYQTTGGRDAASDFDLDSANVRAGGMTFANGRFYVVDWQAGKVFAYQSSGQRDAAFDFDLDSANANATGITFANDLFFVVDSADDKAYAYQSSGQRDRDSDMDLDSANGRGSGITFASGRLFVVDSDADRIYAYSAGAAPEITDTDGDGIADSADTDDDNDGVSDTDDAFPLDPDRSVDSQPGFGADAGPGDQSYTVGTAIDTLTLPAASGGDGTLTYSLSPSVPGLTFNATTRQLTGTPTAAGAHAMTYTVTDADGDTDTLSFTVTVEESDEGGDDKAVLMALYNASDGANWSRSDNWGTNAPLDQWYGVTVDGNGRVIRLELSENQLSGPIPAELGDLANLEWLDLGRNALTGSIPPDLGNLTNLETLDLAYGENALSGSIPPELGNLTNLTWLRLAGNTLSGSIPPELGQLGNLQRLDLDHNELSGSVPSWLGNLTNLHALDLSSNQLSGSIPPELGNLTNLRSWLLLSDNQLSGPIPAELSDLANLEWLWLDGNQLSGPIPAELGDLANLERLYLYDNQLSGPIPAELGDLANLELLWLNGNQLSGPIPAELGDLANLEWLSLGGNQLSGPIPAELGDLANLERLYLYDNQLSGSIPAELGDLANLQWLILSGNQLSGPIPAELGDLANLEWLDLSGNQLSGSIPAELGDFANLQWLSLAGNQLSGCIPDGLRDVPENDLSRLGLTFCGDVTMGGETSYGVDDEITDLPTGTWTASATGEGSQITVSGDSTAVKLEDGGYFEQGGNRYTCQGADGCEINDRKVVSGTIVQTSATTMPEDTQPSFAGGSGPGNQTYTVGTAIGTLTLPAASGGDGTLSYSLSPGVPGLSFIASTRQLTGTPTAAGAHAMTYTATDEDGDTDSLRFTITVQEAVSGSPDLVVQSPSISNANPEPGASITISATVRNQGAGESAATTLRYYRSADATISTGDTEAGTGAVSALAASTGSDESIGLTAPSAAGTYYYGACVDSVSGETDSLNNCSTAVRVTVGDSPMEITGFDLASVNPWATGIVFAGDRFYVVDLAAAKIFAYQSSGERDTASDIDLDSDNGNATGLAFANGRLFVADWNDAKVYAYQTTGARDTASDFDLDSANVRAGGMTFANGRFYVVDWQAGKVFAYQSSGARDTASDFDLDSVNGNATGITFANDLFFVVDSADDKAYAYQSSGQRDRDSDMDLDSANGRGSGITFASGRLFVVDSDADRIYAYSAGAAPEITDTDGDGIADSADTDDDNDGVSDTDDAFPLNPDRTVDSQPSFGAATIANQTYTAGTAIDTLTLPAASGGDGTLTYSLSPDVPGLSFIASTRQLTGTPTAAGTHAMTYTATDEDGDTDSLRFTITVQEAVSVGPDLVVQAPSVSDANPEPGASITISVTVRNQGTSESAATTLHYYRSADATISTADTEVGTDAVSALAAQAISDESLSLTAPSAAGTYYYGACVDPVSGETAVGNNCTDSRAVRVRFDLNPEIYNDNVIVLPVEENVASLWGKNFGHGGPPLRDYAARFYEHFNDEFDFLIFLPNVDANSLVPESFHGAFYVSVKNDVQGIGQQIFSNNSSFGSAGKLQGVIFHSNLDDNSIFRGLLLHELMHRWGNFVVPITSIPGGPHWGFSSSGGYLDCFNISNMIDHGDGTFSAPNPFHARSSEQYSPIELYLAGYIPPEEVPDFQTAEDGDWVLDERGYPAEDENGYRMFTASGFKTHRIEDIIAEHGPRVPDHSQAQKDFRAAVILLVSEDYPATRERLEQLSDDVLWFSQPSRDEAGPPANNFYEAVGGRGTIAMGDLSQFQSRARSNRSAPSLSGTPPLRIVDPKE